MTDYKSAYSEASQSYIEHDVSISEIDHERYLRSKAREELFNGNWKKYPVNLNDICDEFAPGDDGHKDGVKFVFEGMQYTLKADMASGYLRIFDRRAKRYVKLDGTPGFLGETHFKILKREDM